MSELWPWLAVFGLGMFHGINPAMGWLFAVALGLQEQKRAAVFRALTADCAGARAFDWDHHSRGSSGPC